MIVLDDEPDLLIDQLVKFLYLGSYDDSFSKTLGSPWGSMQFNIKVLIAADKYDIPDLGDYASQKLLARLPRVNLKNPAGKQDFLHAVYELYQEGPASATKLRDELKEVGISNSHALFADDFKKSDDGNEETLAFHKLIRDVPEFGDQVMVTLSAAFAEKKKDSVGTSTYRCDTCQTQFVMTHGRYDLKVYCPHCKGPAKKLW